MRVMKILVKGTRLSAGRFVEDHPHDVDILARTSDYRLTVSGGNIRRRQQVRCGARHHRDSGLKNRRFDSCALALTHHRSLVPTGQLLVGTKPACTLLIQERVHANM